MKTPPRQLTGVIFSLLLTAQAIPRLAAGLPIIDDPPWLGYYAVFANRDYQFTMVPRGKIALIPMGEKNQPVAQILTIPIEITIEETLPDGKIVVKEIRPDTLTSAQPATTRLEKSVVTGKVTGDAAFELTLEQSRGLLSLGGRLLDAGTLKNPLRFSLRVRFPSAYARDKTEGKDAKAFEKKTRDDRIDLKWTDMTRKKQAFDEPLDASSSALNGPGIASAALDIGAYKGRKFFFTASQHSVMTLTNAMGPLHEGFTLHWRADPLKDPQGKARLSIELK